MKSIVPTEAIHGRIFMFRLTEKEAKRLRSQNATLNRRRGQHRKYLLYAFTEQGVAMLSSVLNSERAIQVNIAIMRAFVRFREMATTHEEIARRLDELEMNCDSRFKEVFDALRLILEPREKPKGRIGFSPTSPRATSSSKRP